jgi:hypothetical protein
MYYLIYMLMQPYMPRGERGITRRNVSTDIDLIFYPILSKRNKTNRRN